MRVGRRRDQAQRRFRVRGTSGLSRSGAGRNRSLLVRVGHLYATGFNNRWFAQRALESAFRLKAKDATAEKSPTMNGYAAVVQALVSMTHHLPSFDEWAKPLELAQFLPERIWRAVAMADPSQRMAAKLGEPRVDLPDRDKAAFEKAKGTAVKAAKALLEVALTDPDGIVGPYLKGPPPGRKYEGGPWVSQYTGVDRLMEERPDVFRAAAANELAMNALMRQGESDPQRTNMRRLGEVGLGVLSYAFDHGDTFPDSLAVLYSKGYLKHPLEPRSLITGKPYVCVAAGEKVPAKASERNQFIVLYDESASESGFCQCVMADGHGTGLPMDAIKEQLRKRGKH